MLFLINLINLIKLINLINLFLNNTINLYNLLCYIFKYFLNKHIKSNLNGLLLI